VTLISAAVRLLHSRRKAESRYSKRQTRSGENPTGQAVLPRNHPLGFLSAQNLSFPSVSRECNLSDVFGRQRAGNHDMQSTRSTTIVTDRLPNHSAVPLVPIRVHTDGNRKNARRRSGNTVCSPRSRRSDTRGSRTRARPPYYTPLLSERGERREQGGVAPLPYCGFSVPVSRRLNGNGGNRAVGVWRWSA